MSERPMDCGHSAASDVHARSEVPLSEREQRRLACVCGHPLVRHSEYGCWDCGTAEASTPQHSFTRRYANEARSEVPLTAAGRAATVKGHALVHQLTATPARRKANKDVDWDAWVADIEREAIHRNAELEDAERVIENVITQTVSAIEQGAIPHHPESHSHRLIVDAALAALAAPSPEGIDVEMRPHDPRDLFPPRSATGWYLARDYLIAALVYPAADRPHSEEEAQRDLDRLVVGAIEQAIATPEDRHKVFSGDLVTAAEAQADLGEKP